MDQLVRDILGYLNFSSGKPDARFQKNLNDLMADASTVQALRTALVDGLTALEGTEPTFADVQQASRVVELTLEVVFPGYCSHHADLLFHLEERELEQPFLLAKMFEAVLSQQGPWDEDDRIAADAIEQLNDYIGYRPLAVLENEQRMEPYDRERYQPVPLYLRDAGVANGPIPRVDRTHARVSPAHPGRLADRSLVLAGQSGRAVA